MNDEVLAKNILRDLRKKTDFYSLVAKYNISEIKLEGILQKLELDGYEFNDTFDANVRTISRKNSHNSVRTIKQPMNELEHIKLCIVSDTHMGNKLEQRHLLNKVYEMAHEKGIDTVLHCGDVVDGDYRNKRPAHPYDLFAQGASQQLDNVLYNYPKVEGITTYFITGSHDDTHYLNGGFSMGKGISDGREDLVWLGPDQAMFYAGNARVPILIKHPSGGCSKAYSYKPQEAINKLEETTKPKILLEGHYHKSYCMYYNDIYAILVPCLVDQTQFMQKSDLQNVVGAVFLDLYVTKHADIEYFSYDEVRFTDKDIVKNDYLQAKRLVLK
jgi:predicted phosphodiesterase